jgi:hypothetical protein
MAKQMAERIELYMQQDPPGEPLPINIDPIPVDKGTPSEEKIRVAVAGLSNGHAGGALGMHAENVKAWLRGIKLEDDQEVGPPNIGAGYAGLLYLCKQYGITARSPPNSCG